MKAKLINPFLLSLDQTVKNFSGIDIQKQKVEVLTRALNHGANIHVFLGVTGDLYGNVLLSADHRNGLQLASMMVGEDMEDFNDFSISALQELLNITSGNAVTQLAEMGVKTAISPPCFFCRSRVECARLVSPNQRSIICRRGRILSKYSPESKVDES